MQYSIKRKDIAGESIELQQAPISGKVVANNDGKPLERSKEKYGPFQVRMKDGTVKRLFVRPRLLDPVPTVHLEDEEILLARKLFVVEYVFAAVPILMFLIHGPIATVIAFVLLLTNFRILRTKWMPTLKWCAIYALSIVVYWVFALILKLILGTPAH